MLRWRLISATVIVVLLLGLVWLDFQFPLGGVSGTWLVPLAALMVLLAVAEVLELLQGQPSRPAAWAVYLGALLVFLAACVPMLWPLGGTPYPDDCPLGQLGWPWMALALSIPLVFLAEMRRYQGAGGVISKVALSVFVICYVGGLFSFLAALRTLHDHAWGLAALISLLFVVKASDAGAYFCGRSLGRHKLVPTISPGKTVEGAVGGIMTACLASWVFFAYCVPWLVPGSQVATLGWGWLGYGVIVAVAGILGDLAESLLKRDAGRKDSSRWMPGLGGVLDVLDSVLFAAAPAYLCWVAGLVGPGGR